MIKNHPFATFRRAVLSMGLAASLVVAAVPARADNPPKFKDPEVTAFFVKASDLLDSLLAAVKAKDDAKVKELSAKMDDLSKEAKPLKEKVSKEEDEIANKWFNTQFERLSAAGFTPP